MNRLVTLRLAAAAAALLVMFASGCSGDGEEKDVEDAVRAAIQAWNDKDVDAYLAAWTDKGIEEHYGAPREEAAGFVAEFLEQPVEITGFLNTEVSGDSATTDIAVTEGNVAGREHQSLVEEGGMWKLDASEELPVEIPAGVNAVDVELNEFAFQFDAGQVAGGNVGFALENTGEQPHEFVLFSVPPEPDLQEMVDSFLHEREVEGVQDVAFASLEPGESRNLVFTESLESGRYAIVCFFPDLDEGEDGTPHATKGMVAEFTVE